VWVSLAEEVIVVISSAVSCLDAIKLFTLSLQGETITELVGVFAHHISYLALLFKLRLPPFNAVGSLLLLQPF
jgi:hypothetical protein